MSTYYKAVGGVESVALYPADAVVVALFSTEGCEVRLEGKPIEVELLDNGSYYEEHSKTEGGATKISHKLHLKADRKSAEAWLKPQFAERASIEGVVAVVRLCDGRELLVGYSAIFGSEQPLRLESLTSTSGSSPRDIPSVELHLVANDGEFSRQII